MSSCNFLTSLANRPVEWVMMQAVQERMAPGEDWLAQCRQGDAAAWRSLYAEHFPFVFRLAVRMGASEREAADVAQEVFFRVWRGLGSFRGESQFRTWLYRITLNETMRIRRSHGLQRALQGLLGLAGFSEPAGPSTPDRALEQSEALTELRAILARMKPKQRTVFVLFEIEELALEEIAGILECPLETVRSRLRHARAELQRYRRQRQATGSAGEGGGQ